MLVKFARAQAWCSFLSLLVVSFAHPSPAVAHNARHHLQAGRVKRQTGLNEPRDFQDFNLNAADVFPADLQLKDHDKRGLLGAVTALVGGAGDLVVDVLTIALGNGQVITTTVTSTTTQQAATSAANGGNNGGSPTTTPNSGNTPTGASTPSSTPNNGNGNAAGTSNAGNGNDNGSGNGGTVSKSPDDTSVAGSAGTVAPINHNVSGSASRQGATGVVTDHFGNTITGTAPVTQTWVTTLPNGVVSTVTATFTPGTPDTAPSATHPMTRGKIAAIVGTIVALFIVIFSCALVMLLIRKRTRAIQLTRSRPNSAGSFDSFTNGDADERRDSRVGLTVGTMSSHSFKTAPAFIDGAHMEFPLPPAPETSAAGGAGRPLSGESQSTDYGFTGQMSRASLLEDRNQFRKIGQYPAAGSYTPFAFPPSSDLEHSEEGIQCTYSPTAVAFAIDQRLNTLPEKSFNQDYTSIRSETPLTASYENPFSDPSPASTTPTTPSVGVHNTLMGNSGARKTTLWRTSTIGSDITTPTLAPAPPRKTKILPLSKNDDIPQRAPEPEREPTIDLTREPSTSSSTGRRSFYSASESLKEELRVSQMYPSDPFADPQNYVMKTPNSSQGQGIDYPDLRPGTNGTSTSISSAVDSDFGRRDLGESPDPNSSGLFWPTSRPSTAQSPLGGQF